MREAAAVRPVAVVQGALAAGLAAAVALGISEVVQRFVAVQTVEVVFLTAVVVVAVRFGLLPSLAAVVGGSLCYNFFFLPPIYTFTIADPSNIAALFFFTVVAVLVSNLAAKTRSEAVIAQAASTASEQDSLSARLMPFRQGWADTVNGVEDR